MENGIEETLAHHDFPSKHWHIRTSNVTERVSRKLRRRANVAAAFSDGRSALMLAQRADSLQGDFLQALQLENRNFCTYHIDNMRVSHIAICAGIILPI